jgi:hypothetical protein
LVKYQQQIGKHRIPVLFRGYNHHVVQGCLTNSEDPPQHMFEFTEARLITSIICEFVYTSCLRCEPEYALK